MKFLPWIIGALIGVSVSCITFVVLFTAFQLGEAFGWYLIFDIDALLRREPFLKVFWFMILTDLVIVVLSIWAGLKSRKAFQNRTWGQSEVTAVKRVNCWNRG